MKQDSIRIAADSQAKFNNNTAFCIGTGRMGLALQREYQQQLAMAQAECAFTHIRGHGLFSDDMAIYQPYQDAEGTWHRQHGHERSRHGNRHRLHRHGIPQASHS